MEDKDRFDALTWWEVYGGMGLLPKLAKKVLSQVVNTSFAERCWSTYSFIHNVRRNRLNENRAESLVYVHYNLRLLSHYCDQAYEDQSYKVWDNNPEDDNLEDSTIHMEELEAELLRDDDEASVAMPLPHTGPVSPSSSNADANASARYPTIVPLQIQAPPTSSRFPPPSSHGRCTLESTRRPPLPRGSHKLDFSHGRGKGPANR